MTTKGIDWSLGCYEHIANGLLPAARTVVEHAALRSGERVLDVGCGTGNASLLAARLGAKVTGVDPSDRLLALARVEATSHRLDAVFLRGEAAALPLTDATADVLLSVFGVIFAPDASAAAAEMARVTASRGRIVLCAWSPGGPMSEMMRVRRDALATVMGRSSGPPPFLWHDRDALTALLALYGFAVTTHEHSLAFTASSSKGFLESEFTNHPLWMAFVLCSSRAASGSLCKSVLSKSLEPPTKTRTPSA